MYRAIHKCRICGSEQLERVLSLGTQMLTGVFPDTRDESITSGPLSLVKCDGGDDVCGLLQLEHTFDHAEMYGDNYGYRSGLNPTMVSHLEAKVARIRRSIQLENGDLVVDVGSNDGTTLKAYPSSGLVLAGIDPTAEKFRQFYPSHIQILPDFFSLALMQQAFGERRARVITSFSMFYDLEDPMAFMREIHGALADDGIWVFEQSHMPTMVAMNAYDTICHEHLEFYAMRQIKWMTDRTGFVIVDVEFNEVNGGSFSVTVAKQGHGTQTALLSSILDDEERRGFNTLTPYLAFADRVASLRTELQRFVWNARAAGKTVAALGASTKGNVILQFCGFTEQDVQCIGEVNPEKFGCFAPGTWIPIVPQQQLLQQNPDYLLILPWHFRSFFISKSAFSGRRLVFPLPRLEIVETTRAEPLAG